MFASCCNWLCMDSGEGVGQSAAERRHQSYTNSGFNSQPSPSGSPSEPSCKACGGRLDTPATKVTPPSPPPPPAGCSLDSLD
uniref:Uncharacterized protein n=1 Tax=Sander lucioperca TaxID=283035 RepID=A0A8C9XCN9_SANLU